MPETLLIEIEVRIEWLAFRLDPDMPAEGATDWPEAAGKARLAGAYPPDLLAPAIREAMAQ